MGVGEGSAEGQRVVRKNSVVTVSSGSAGEIGTAWPGLQYGQEAGARVKAAEPYVTSRCQYRTETLVDQVQRLAALRGPRKRGRQ